MPLQIIRNDITKVECDAIVNAANSTLLGGGGVDGAIHKAAGKALLKECQKLHGCNVGEAKITGGYKLPSKYVIHTVGPKWRGGSNNEEALLQSCYYNSLQLAKEHQCQSIAFPLISSGVYGYPMDKAFDVAVSAIAAFLENNDMLVYIVVFGSDAVKVGQSRFDDITQYIDDNYIAEHPVLENRRMDCYQESVRLEADMPCYQKSSNDVEPEYTIAAAPMAAYDADEYNLDDLIGMVDESFSQMLLRKIDEKGIKDSECYKKANIDRKLFSKIKSNPDYRPSKPTVLAFCIALELSLEDTKEMLLKAGFALSHSNKFDIIIEYFIKKGIYNIFEINEALFSFDQNLLGG